MYSDFESSDDFDEAEIIDQFLKLNDGDSLPLEGPCYFFYHYLNAEGEIFIINDDQRFEIFNIDHDNVISALEHDKYSWNITNEDNILTITLLLRYDDSFITIPISFRKGNKKSDYYLQMIKEAKEIKVNFLNILFGKIVKEKTGFYKIPDKIIDQLSFEK